MFVVAGGDAAPVLELVEGPFDDVAARVGVGVEVDRPATSESPPLAVPDLVGGFGDDRGDPPRAQQGTVRPGGIRLVPAQGGRGGPWSSRSDPRDPKLSQQQRQCPGVAGLAGCDGDDQWAPTPVDQRVGLGRQTPAGPADAVIVRFVPAITGFLVIR